MPPHPTKQNFLQMSHQDAGEIHGAQQTKEQTPSVNHVVAGETAAQSQLHPALAGSQHPG